VTLAPTVIFNSIKCINYEFWKKLRECRDTKNLSQSQLAKEVGVHQNVIGRYELEEAKPSIEIASKIRDIFNVSLDYLIGKTELLIDEDVSARILTIQKLPDSDREHILFTIDAMIRDAKARLAYS
jgi:transcriptional regulator with XRE-family HTH domain